MSSFSHRCSLQGHNRKHMSPIAAYRFGRFTAHYECKDGHTACHVINTKENKDQKIHTNMCEVHNKLFTLTGSFQQIRRNINSVGVGLCFRQQ